MTLIVGDNQALLLDTGYGIDHLIETINQITNLPLTVVNSHGHLDHILGNRYFNEVHLHPADLKIYKEHTKIDRKRSITNLRTTRPELFPEDFSIETYIKETNAKILPIDDGDTFSLGGVNLKVIHIPGHTPGGIALLDDRDQLLLTGDMVSPHVWIFLRESTDINTYINSLEKLQKLSNQYQGIIASHVPSILPNNMVQRLIHCAKNIDPRKSIPFSPPFEDLEPANMYYEGFDSLKKGLKIRELDLEKQPLYSLNLDFLDYMKVNFVSIVYDESKL